MQRIHSVPVLRVRALTKQYRRGTSTHPSFRSVLRDVDLDVHTNEIVTAVGPEGVGKSTLLLCLSGLLRPTSGVVQWALPPLPSNLERQPSLQRRQRNRASGIVYVPQRVAFYGFLTVREVLDYYAMSNSPVPINPNNRLDDALGAVGLAAVAHAPVSTLSGSMIRRLQVAQALLSRPQALLLDETLSGVDGETFQALRSVIHNLVAAGTAVIVATQDAGLPSRLGARVVTFGGTVREPNRVDASAALFPEAASAVVPNVLSPASSGSLS